MNFRAIRERVTQTFRPKNISIEDEAKIDDMIRRERRNAYEQGLAAPNSEIARIIPYIANLPQEQREALLLHVNDGLNYHQIATKLHVTQPVVLKRLVRAYSTIRMQMGNQL